MKRKGYLAGLLLAWVLLGAGCKNGEAAPELYLDKGIPETPVAIFTQNDSVSQVVKECCEKVLNKDGTTNIVVYSDSAGYYADEGLSYRELLLKRLSSGTADDLYLIPAEDVLEFDEKGYIYDLSDLKCIRNLSKDALIQSTYDGKVFSLPLSYTCFGFVWNVDMLKQYDLAVPENREEFLNVCETLKENGILPYGANKDFGLTVPVMCAGLYDVYQGEGTEQKLQELSEGTTPVSEYMRKGFDFLQMMIDKGYMDPEKALDTIPSSDGEKEFFAQENPNAKHLEAAITVVEALGQTEILDAFAQNLGKISSSKNATAPAIPQSDSIISCVVKGSQIPNQDFRLHFNVWDTVRDLSQMLCQGHSPAEVSKEYDSRQMKEISMYGKHG